MELFLLLPFFLHKKTNDKTWSLYLTLRSIVSIVFCDKIDRIWLNRLTSFIKVFFNLYNELYPEETVTPKMHFMIHYPELINAFGPVSHFSTFRYERKHYFFKRLAPNMRNYKNITLSLAKRHQRVKALQTLEKKSSIKYEKLWTANLNSKINNFRELIFNNSNNIMETNSIEIDNMILKINRFYVIKTNPIFAKIKNIFFKDNDILLFVDIFEGNFDKNLFAYKLIDKKKTEILTIDSIIYYKKCQEYNYLNNLYIIKFVQFTDK